MKTAFEKPWADINILVNGDKILVEPLFAVKLEQQYHALTVTEIAIYGAKTLGYDSDGGSPSTGANGKYLSFISNKTNREFANMLHIPYDLNDNGNQKIWTGAITLTGRDSFYNIINSAYGVGYAYTETKASDFVPNLKVKKVDVRKGKALETHEQLGTSFGNTFEEYGFDKFL
ncbi:MAG: hypothetical protein RR073_01740 [Clostridia bacterium]